MSGWIAADTLDRDGLVGPRPRADRAFRGGTEPRRHRLIAVHRVPLERRRDGTMNSLSIDDPNLESRRSPPGRLAIAAPVAVPGDRRWLFRVFRKYAGATSAAISTPCGSRASGPCPSSPDGPLIVVMNHPRGGTR